MMKTNFMVFLFSFALSVSALAQTQPSCPDLHLNGHWKTAEGTFFFRNSKTYEIQQQGCYALVYDTYRGATWKIDLSGQHTIKAPSETIMANFQAGGDTAAKNIEGVEVKLTPSGGASNYYAADLDTTVVLARQPSFPIDTKIRFKALLEIWDQSGCGGVCSSSPSSINITLHEVEILDMIGGIPHGVEKSSFLSGINSALKMFLTAFSYKMTAVSLVKD